jgi:TolB-like protein/DNA-binding SARP family transcriptional activator
VTQARLELLGGFRLTSAAGLQVDVMAKKNRALLGILAMAPHGETTRDQLSGLLWSDRGAEQARNSLRQGLVALRRELMDLDTDPLLLNGDRIGLDPRRIIVDVSEFLAVSASEEVADLRRAATLYAGPFLDGLSVTDNAFEEWLREARADLSARALKVLENLTSTLNGAERVAVAERLVALDPLRESSHAILVQALLADGQSGLARRQLETCRLLLKRELGIEPGEELQKLFRLLNVSKSRAGGVSRKPVIAVMPFENMSGDPAQQYFSDGITEDIIDRLSRYRILSVIGPSSSFALRTRADHLPEIKVKLDADYVVTGNIRKSDERVRIAVRLTEAATGRALWADHYDRPLRDILALQDEVANLVAFTLMGRVELETATRSPSLSTAGISSYDHVLQGMWHFKKLTVTATATAAECFQNAIAADPGNAEAHRWLSGCHLNGWFLEFRRHDLSVALRLAARAIELDPASATCHTAYAYSMLMAEGVDAAQPAYQKAFSLNPGDPAVLVELGLLNAYAGDLGTARSYFVQAFRLNPLPPLWYGDMRGVADFAEGQYAAALPAFAAVRDCAWDVMYVLSCLGHLGKRTEAIALLSRLRAAGRNWDFLAAAAAEPYRAGEPRQRLIAGLETALSF